MLHTYTYKFKLCRNCIARKMTVEHSDHYFIIKSSNNNDEIMVDFVNRLDQENSMFFVMFKPSLPKNILP